MGGSGGTPPRGAAVLVRRVRPRCLLRVTSCTSCAARTLPRHLRTFRGRYLSDTTSMPPPPAPRPRAEPGPLGSARDPSFELWATKHVPACEATLVVAKKRWMSFGSGSRAGTRRGGPASPRVLLIVGPPGSGKGAAVRFVAREFGRASCTSERAPVPTLWDEHKHANAFADGVAGSLAPAYSSSRRLRRVRAERRLRAARVRRRRGGAGPSAENVRSNFSGSTATAGTTMHGTEARQAALRNQSSPCCWWRTCPSAAARTSTGARSSF